MIVQRLRVAGETWARYLWAFIACICAPEVAEARSVALLIGNSAYEHAAPLTNPGNDVDDMAVALGDAGFDVRVVHDADFSAMRRALVAFSAVAAEAEVAVVFFAGHGLGVDGETWLVPTDAEVRTEAAVDAETIPLKSVLDAIDGASRLKLVILDACREDPFTARMAAAPGRTRTISRGLARIDHWSDTVIWYAARAGSVALDGSGRNSPFTAALLRHISRPGLELDKLFRHVTADVRSGTANEQTPAQYGVRGVEDFFFTSAAAPLPAAAPTSTTAAPNAAEAAFALSLAIPSPSTRALALEAFLEKYPETVLRERAEAALAAARGADEAATNPAQAAWEAVRETRTVSELEQFLSAFPNSPYTAEAQSKIVQLRNQYMDAQRKLAALGCFQGAADGAWGERSMAALRLYEDAMGLPVDGELSEADASNLRSSPYPESWGLAVNICQ